MQHLEGSGTPVLYIGRTVLQGLCVCVCVCVCACVRAPPEAIIIVHLLYTSSTLGVNELRDGGSALLHRIREVQGSNLGPETGCCDWVTS